MKNIRTYVSEFFRQQSKGYLLLIILLLSALLYFNYWHGMEKLYISSHDLFAENFLGYYLLYFSVMIIAFLMQFLFSTDKKYFKNSWFWIIVLLAPAIFSLRVNMHFIYNEFDSVAALSKDRLFSFELLIKTIITILAVYLVWLLHDRKEMPFYGVKKLRNYRPYFIMLLLMLPLIAVASTQHDFLQKYPRVQVLSVFPVNNLRDLFELIIYELTYALNFLSIEFFFRGFLVLALVKYCGLDCIIPVACFYVAIHLGKPMGEAVSSFFGGALLGIITYNTKSIWGGLIVHIGIAWLMEIGGSIGNYLMD